MEFLNVRELNCASLAVSLGRNVIGVPDPLPPCTCNKGACAFGEEDGMWDSSLHR